MSIQLQDKVVLITGSSRGLGKVLAKRFLEEGVAVVITGANQAELDRAEKDLRQVSSQLLSVAAEIQNEPAVQHLVERAVAQFSRIDILINNAGVFRSGPVEEFALADFELTFGVNVKGAFLVTKHVVRQMKKQSAGQIINICSIGAKLGLEKLSAYCASKAALALFGDALKAELKPYRIRVTNVFPHAMNTQKTPVEADSPRRAQLVEPEDIAEALIAVASSKQYMQYQDLVIYPYSTKLTKTEDL